MTLGDEVSVDGLDGFVDIADELFFVRGGLVGHPPDDVQSVCGLDESPDIDVARRSELRNGLFIDRLVDQFITVADVFIVARDAGLATVVCADDVHGQLVVTQFLENRGHLQQLQ